MGRFSEAISEGDGISVIPVLRGDLGALAGVAADAGAEAVAVWTAGEVDLARGRTELPILVRRPDVDRDRTDVSVGEADACVFAFSELGGDEGVLEALSLRAAEDGLDCAVEVRDEEELEETLERLDPDIILVSHRGPANGEELDRTLELLADVPAGKLVIAESAVTTREAVLALERAGVDAALVRAELLGANEFAAALEELARGTGTGA